jgi:hypothetical protein
VAPDLPLPNERKKEINLLPHWLIQQIIAVIVVTGTIGLATASDAEDLEKAAKDKFDTAVSLVASREYEQAIELFNDAYEMWPKTRILYNIGMCYKALKRYPESILILGQYLMNVGDAPKPDMREQANLALEALSKEVGFLSIETVASNGVLVVDNGPTLKVPLEAPYPLEVGAHQISISAPNHVNFKDKFVVSAGETKRLRVELAPESTPVHIRCVNEEGASVFIDGEWVGACPYEGILKNGTYLLEVRAPGKQSFSGTIDIEGGQKMEKDVSLIAIVPPPEDNNPAVTATEHPPLEIGDKTESSRGDGISTLQILGMVSTGVGLGALSGAIVFTVRAEQDIEEARQIRNMPPTERDQYKDKYNNIKNEKVPLGNVVTAVAYGSAGLFLVAGAVLFIYDARVKKRKTASRELSRPFFDTNGIGCRF